MEYTQLCEANNKETSNGQHTGIGRYLDGKSARWQAVLRDDELLRSSVRHHHTCRHAALPTPSSPPCPIATMTHTNATDAALAGHIMVAQVLDNIKVQDTQKLPRYTDAPHVMRRRPPTSGGGTLSTHAHARR